MTSSCLSNLRHVNCSRSICCPSFNKWSWLVYGVVMTTPIHQIPGYRQANGLQICRLAANILNKHCRTKSQVSLWQGIAPGHHPARVRDEDNGSRFLDMKACRFRQTYSLNVLQEGVLQKICRRHKWKGPKHPS